MLLQMNIQLENSTVQARALSKISCKREFWATRRTNQYGHNIDNWRVVALGTSWRRATHFNNVGALNEICGK